MLQQGVDGGGVGLPTGAGQLVADQLLPLAVSPRGGCLDVTALPRLLGLGRDRTDPAGAVGDQDEDDVRVGILEPDRDLLGEAAGDRLGTAHDDTAVPAEQRRGPHLREAGGFDRVDVLDVEIRRAGP